MANGIDVTFRRGNKSTVDSTEIVDGQILFTTDNAPNDMIYADVGTERIHIGGTNTVDTATSTTSGNPIANKTITKYVQSEVKDLNTEITGLTNNVDKIMSDTGKISSNITSWSNGSIKINSDGDGIHRVGRIVQMFFQFKVAPQKISGDNNDFGNIMQIPMWNITLNNLDIQNIDYSPQISVGSAGNFYTIVPTVQDYEENKFMWININKWGGAWTFSPDETVVFNVTAICYNN